MDGNKVNSLLSRQLLSIMHMTGIKDFNTFVDIGAADGTYSQAAKDIGFKAVHCFEPRSNATLNEKVLSYSSDGSSRIHRCALSDFNGGVKFFEDRVRRNRSSLIRPDHPKEQVGNEYLVYYCEVKTLDSFSIKDISFIKIDVEGNELKVIEGAINTLQDTKAVLLVEISRDCNEVVSALKELDYIPCGYHGNSASVYEVSPDLQFLPNPYGKGYLWTDSLRNFNPLSPIYARENARDDNKYDYKEGLPIWGDFVFKKVDK
jgi:FkbM family methyltransferase